MSNIEAASNVKDMLLSGVSKEELIDALEKEITAAQKEIDEAEAAKAKEKESNDALKQAREKMILAIVEYLDFVGIIDKNIINSEDIEEIGNAVAEVEKDYFPLMLFTSKIKGVKGKKSTKDTTSTNKSIDADDIIKEFLKSL